MAGAGGAADSAAVDPFGIRELYPSAPSGAVWSSQHWSSGTYTIEDRIDANDPLALSGMRGTGTLAVTGDGELVMGGSQPRLYVYPGDAGPWRDVEVTVYYRRVADAGEAFAGLVIGARSGAEGHGDTPCEAHTYYARLRHDGAVDFAKELMHPESAARQRVEAETAWPGGGALPFDVWIGFKLVAYNLAEPGTVKLEAYRDLTGGADGGSWELLNEIVDDAGWFANTTCVEHSPSGEQSDMVVVDGGTTFIRNTEISEARYRWMSVREIAP
jgi:hypothetical protein